MAVLSNNPHYKSSYITIDVQKTDIVGNQLIKTVLVIETDLILDAIHKDYDQTAVDQFLADAHEATASNEAIGRVQINPRR